jgi:hypothetical protein
MSTRIPDNERAVPGAEQQAIERLRLAVNAIALHKYDATTAPGVGDDANDGYEPGSLWVDVSGDAAYVCVDATVGAAVWVECGGGGSGTGDMTKAVYDTDNDGLVDDSASTRALYTWPLASNAEPPDGAGLIFDGASKTWKVTAANGAAFANYYGEDVANHSGLDYAYFGGLVRDDNAISTTADGTVTLADDDVSYVEVDPATGAVSDNVTGFTAGKIPLAEVTTAAGAITAVVDCRTWAATGPGGGGADTDPVVGAITGIVTADGAGNISALSPETVDESDVTISNGSAVTTFDADDTTLNEVADYVAQVDTKLDAVIAALQTLGLFEATP